MQINSLGQLTKQPEEILPSLRRVTGGIWLGPSNPGQLSFWLSGDVNAYSNKGFQAQRMFFLLQGWNG